MSERQVPVTLRPARLEDCRSVWEWRNDPDTREASFNTEAIFFEEHRAWFESRIGSPEVRIFIVLSPEGTEIGYVRFQLRGSDAEVSVALSPEERGKGYGTAALRAAAEQLLSEGKVTQVVALIKISNSGSRQAFERAGFRLQGSRKVGLEEAWQMEKVREGPEG